MARDPKTGRFVKDSGKTAEHKSEDELYDDLEKMGDECDWYFDDTPEPPTSDDYDFMKAIIIGISAAAIGGLAFAFFYC